MKLLRAIVVGAIALATAPTAINAVPVVPNFTQGSMTSHTETTSTVSETINSMDYNTGYQYSVSGVNVQHDGTGLSTHTVIQRTTTIQSVTDTTSIFSQ